MSEKEIYDTLLEIIEESLDDPDLDFSKITGETEIFKDLIKNSISAMYVALAIEDRFQVEIDNEEIKSLKTVGDFISFIQSKQ